LWTAAEISDALGPEEARIFAFHYGVQSAGNVPDAYDPRGEFRGRNVLVERQPVAESARQLGLTEDAARQSLASSKERLFALRDSRPPPVRDEKVLAAWNGLMISAFAQVGVALNDARYARAAASAAKFVRNHLYDAKSGTLRRSWKEGTAQIPGFAQDYAFLILVVLYAEDANALSGDAAQALAAMRPIQGRPALYLCENFTCRAPVTSPEDARRLLDRIPEKRLD
jgi:uncharacterized protein